MKLSEAFKKIKPAKCIRVTAKGITEIDIVHSSYSIIQELFLQDNRLKSISNISQFPNLTRVALENNAISDIEELEDIRNLPNLKEVRLKGNPICNIPLFHQQIANFFEDYIIIDSKRVQFTKNKAKYENYIIFSIFISDFFAKIQKKPKIDFLTSQLNSFLKKNNYVSFAHKLRYSYLKCETKTYFIHLKQICSQKIHSGCEKCSSFESLSNFIAKIYYSKISYLSENDIKKLNLPFFNNSVSDTKESSSTLQTTNTFYPLIDVNSFYSCCCFKGKTRTIIPQIKSPVKSKTKNIETDEGSTVAFDIDIEITNENNSTSHQSNKVFQDLNEGKYINDIHIGNNLFQNFVTNQYSESSIRKTPLKKDSKNWLSMPSIESDFSTLSFQRDVVFSEPFNIKGRNNKKLINPLSIEESAEFSLASTQEPHESHIQENDHIELLNTSSSSSSNSKSRKSSLRLSLSTSSSSSSFTVINSPLSSMMIPPNKQKFPTSPRNKVKVLNPGNKMNLPPKLSTSSSSFGNIEADKTEENNTQSHTSDENNDDNKNLVGNNKNNQKKSTTSSNNESNLISEENTHNIENENEGEITTNENAQTRKRKKVRRKKKTFPDDSVSEVFED